MAWTSHHEYGDRYTTEAEALAGHDAMVARWMMAHNA